MWRPVVTASLLQSLEVRELGGVGVRYYAGAA